MILVDTSAWVRTLRGVPAYRDGLAELRYKKALGGHEFVHVEGGSSVSKNVEIARRRRG
ncbi:MAG TPA: hypothetical protein VN709_03025 [Terriglobales bacterium]|nr:hypothetical protein [Terriglobales bacterium]